MSELKNNIPTLEELLKNSDFYCVIDGNGSRLYWQEDDTELAKQHGWIVENYVAGWKVITWKRGKVIELYYGKSLLEAIRIFEEFNVSKK